MSTLHISTDQLRLGMFIHLDLSWMSHPFPLSSFKLGSQSQIDTVRSLKLRTVRWDPSRSDAAAVAGAGRLDAGDATAGGELEGAADLAALSALGERSARLAGDDQDASTARGPTDGTADATPTPRVRQLEAQVAALNRCEQQFGLACQDLRRVNELVLGQPTQAHDSAAALTRSLLGKMIGGGPVNVRVLGEPPGDRYSAHAINVAVVSLLLGSHIGLPQDALADLGVGALLHDVGKLGLPDRLRLRRADFSSHELSAYRNHVALGIAQGQRLGLAPGALLVLAQHHERADGSGFPLGFEGGAMSRLAHIVALVDAFDNLCNPSDPMQTLTPHEALSRMFAQSQQQFDAELLGAFIRLIGIYPPGSLVQLSDERYAMVVAVNSGNPLRPQLLVYEPGAAARDALHLNLVHEPALSVRRSLKAAALPPAAREFLAPRRRLTYFFDAEDPSAAVAPGVSAGHGSALSSAA